MSGARLGPCVPSGRRRCCGLAVALLGHFGSRQSWADARAPAGHGSRCGPSWDALGQIGQRFPICQRKSLKFSKTPIFQNYQGLYGFTRENGCKICANVQTLGRNFVYFRPCFRAFSLVQWYRGRRDCLQPGPPVRGTRAAARPVPHWPIFQGLERRCNRWQSYTTNCFNCLKAGV